MLIANLAQRKSEKKVRPEKETFGLLAGSGLDDSEAAYRMSVHWGSSGNRR